MCNHSLKETFYSFIARPRRRRHYVFALSVRHVRSFVRSCERLLPRCFMNSLCNIDETYRKYLLSPTDDLMRFWRSKVKATAGCRGGKVHLVLYVTVNYDLNDLDLNRIRMNYLARCVCHCQRSFSSKLGYFRETHTHTGQMALCEPLRWWGDWKRRSGKHGTIMQGWKTREKPVWKATLWRLWRHKTSVARTQVFFNVIYLMFLID